MLDGFSQDRNTFIYGVRESYSTHHCHETCLGHREKGDADPTSSLPLHLPSLCHSDSYQQPFAPRH